MTDPARDQQLTDTQRPLPDARRLLPDAFGLFSLSGRSALVTGGAEGLGKAIAVGLAAFGANVAVADINLSGAEAAAEEARVLGVQAAAFACDNSQPDQIEALFVQLTESFPPLDILVNNVGVIARRRPEELPLADWERVVRINLTGTFLCAQAAGRGMIARGKGGSIINVSSIAGWTALGRGNFVYSITKSGINQLTRELAVEWAQHGIRVNAVMPAQVRTAYLQRMFDTPDFGGEALRQQLLKGIPLNRLGEAQDLIGPVVFLASEAAAFITGAMLPVDGGNLALNAGGSKTW
jgi:NAD(P)-dependent dehydrogenase (short-subunit alcohol dehydrogenase family)